MQIEREKKLQNGDRENNAEARFVSFQQQQNQKETETGYRAVVAAATKHGAAREYARDRQRKSSRQ